MELSLCASLTIFRISTIRRYRSCTVCHDHSSIPFPTLTFDDRLTLDLGDLTLECIYFGDAASWGDVMVRVPEENLIWTGDVFHA
ncbi:hypothetical protein ACFL3H_10450, partial [Gemmatimonadota bacterium]